MTLAARIQQALSMMFGGGAPLSNRNGFIDGTFAFYAGATSPANLPQNPGTYVGPTAWRTGAGTGGVGTVQQVDIRSSADLAYMEGDDTTTCVSLTITTGSTGTVAARSCAAIWQPIEGAGKYAGRSVTVSVKLKSTTGMVIPSLIAQQSFGSGGSPSSSVTFDKAVTWNTTTAWKKFSVRIDFPSVIGKSFGTNGDSSTGIGLWLPPGVVGTLYIAEFQVELCSPNASPDLNGNGGNPTSYEHRGWQAELARVQRHYQSSDNPYGSLVGNAVFSGSVSSGAVYYASVKFPVPMRGTPAVSLSQNAQSGFNLVSAAYTAGPNANGFALNNAAVSTTAQGSMWYGWLADARL